MMRAILFVLSAGLLAVSSSAVDVTPAVDLTSAKVYGFGSVVGDQYLDLIDTKTGAKKHLGSPVAKELSAQQLSSIDSVNKVYYLLDFNETSKNPNLLGLSLHDGSVLVDQEIVMSESMFVGVGQYMAADVATGCVVIADYDAKAGAYHVIQGCPFGPDPTTWKTVTKITAPNIGLLGSCSAIDAHRGLFYATMPVPPQRGASATASDGTMHMVKLDANLSTATVVRTHVPSTTVRDTGAPLNQPPPPPVPPFEIDLVAVSIQAATLGKVSYLGKPGVGTLAYDSVKKHIVGFGGKMTASGKYEKTLAIAPIPPSKTYKTIGVVKGWEGQMGPISTVDSKSRIHYSMLAPPPKNLWVAATDCSPACGSGNSCCHVPPLPGACFNVPSCSDMGGGAPNMSAPFYLVGLSLDDASVVDPKPPPLCSITDGMCPWSLEVAAP